MAEKTCSKVDFIAKSRPILSLKVKRAGLTPPLEKCGSSRFVNCIRSSLPTFFVTDSRDFFRKIHHYYSGNDVLPKTGSDVTRIIQTTRFPYPGVTSNFVAWKTYVHWTRQSTQDLRRQSNRSSIVLCISGRFFYIKNWNTHPHVSLFLIRVILKLFTKFEKL